MIVTNDDKLWISRPPGKLTHSFFTLIIDGFRYSRSSFVLFKLNLIQHDLPRFIKLIVLEEGYYFSHK